ncbi:MAG: DNA mismatch repair protein MutS [Pirellulales bacterium]|nr:DNA mismatch repair protein MutS [Pirellulales bacterium]
MDVTPMMRQYSEAKRACPEALLLFRMGDFYEMFYDDAKTAARVLGLALTSREKGENAVPMAGFPHHQLESYLGKLITAGFRAAVCEQVEDPKKAKGLVKREVTRIVTPGTVTDDSLLDPRESNFLAAIAPGEPAGLAWVELSTGRFTAAGFPRRQIADQLARIAPAECLLAEEDEPLPEHLSERMMVSRRPAWAFSVQTAQKTLEKHLGTATLEGFGLTDSPEDQQAIRAAGAILDYLVETQKSSLEHIDRLTPYRSSGTLEIDEASRRSLEITRTLRDGRREGSLLAVLDRTVTAMGSRLLAEWLANPLTDAAEIRKRSEAVGELVAEAALSADLHETLRRVYDVERLLARVTTGRASPRDLSFLGRTLRSLPALKAKLRGCLPSPFGRGARGEGCLRNNENTLDATQSDRPHPGPLPEGEGTICMLCGNPHASRKSKLLNELEAAVDLCPDLRATLDAGLIDDCPLSSRDGGFIRDGFSEELDNLRNLARGGKQWIAQYQARELERTGIPNLKVGFNKVFGYYLEVTNPHRDKIPPEYIRKQTIKNAERYITPELKEYEEKVLTADDRSKELEYGLFVRLRETVAAERRRMAAAAAVLARLDVLVALAELARQRNYCRPEITGQPILKIIDGRHPVLDIMEPEGTFVPNDTLVGCVQRTGQEVTNESLEPVCSTHPITNSGSILLITGPNMAGKSTYIRQVALISLLTQIGSFVPARSATIGIADRIFARVGASDELARGQSTFMVEMTETARILNTATPRSLVILDEIGRGTSTYDGISLAWAAVEYLHEHLGCRTLFATHYHELTDLEKSLPGVKNLNVAVREWQDHVVFLHKIVEGAADKSYGIHVARLAGVPREVIGRSKDILAQLEEEHLDAEGRAKIAKPLKIPERRAHYQLTLFGADHPMLDDLRALDLDATTPLEALQLLQQWKRRLETEKKK